jgi:hypothetical protein
VAVKPLYISLAGTAEHGSSRKGILISLVGGAAQIEAVSKPSIGLKIKAGGRFKPEK